jgi:hypothetical protein
MPPSSRARRTHIIADPYLKVLQQLIAAVTPTIYDHIPHHRPIRERHGQPRVGHTNATHANVEVGVAATGVGGDPVHAQRRLELRK